MYIVEALKKEVNLNKTLLEDLDLYDSYLQRHFATGDNLEKIYNSDKPSYQFFKEAWVALAEGRRGDYNKYMCKYSQTMNSDPDFLRYFIKTMFGETEDLEGLSVEQLKDFIKEKYAIREAR